MKKSLIIFTSGILFISCIIPILDSITSLICTWLESKKYKIINQANNNEEQLEVKTPQVGFYIPSEENRSEEEENDI